MVQYRDGTQAIHATPEEIRESSALWFARGSNDGEKKKTGFEKFLKKTRKGADAKAEDKKEDGKKDDKKASQEELSDDPEAEEETEAKQKEKEKKTTKEEGAREKFNQFFMKPGSSGPNGGGPRWENIGLVAFLAGALGFSMVKDWKPNSEEVTYMDFINLYLAKGRCK